MTHAATRRIAATRAAEAVAREQGLAFEEAAVLGDGSNVVVWLRPTRTVARVATTTAAVRPGNAWLRRELAIVRHLTGKRAPSAAPATEIDPGPHEHAGLALAFLEYIDVLDGEPVDPRAAGRALRQCHAALGDFPGELPAFPVLSEIRRVLEHLALDAGTTALFERTTSRLEREVAEARFTLRPLHGDAHLSNVLGTHDGPLWGDWEDAFAGPLAWDLACLVGSARVLGVDRDRAEAAFEAYGEPVPQAELDLCIELRTLYAAAWGLQIGGQLGLPAGRAEARLAWLASREAQP